MEFLNSILPFLLVLSVLVFAHEWGHYYVARRQGVAVEAFSIGFGKEIYAFIDRHGTRWRIAIIPLGGYVRFFGDDDATSLTKKKKMSAADRAKSFHGQTPMRRIMILLAGPLANIVAAVAILFLAFALYGERQLRPVVSELVTDGAAAQAGMKIGDEVLFVGETKIGSFDDLVKQTHLYEGVAMPLQIKRDDSIIEILVAPRLTTPEEGGEPRYMLGVMGGEMAIQSLSITQALAQSFEVTFTMTARVLSAVGRLVTGQISLDQLGGPVKIAQLSGESWESGAYNLLTFMAFISVNLAIFNMLPIPPLDGGHILMTTFEAVRRRPLSDELLMRGQMAGVMLVMMIFVYVTWNDIMRLLGD